VSALKGTVVASESKEELNKSVGTEILVPCIKCSGKTAHDVVASVDQSGYAEEVEISWDQKHQIIRCKGCKTLSFRSEASNSEDYYQIGENEWEYDINEKLYPSRIEGMKDLGPDVVYLPSDLRRVYAETTQALNNDSPVLAGIGLRALVETVCKEKSAQGKDLYEKINDLAAKHVLTPSGAEILHKVRTLGNKAAHEVKPHTQRQLSLAMSVVEHMLKDVYILPKLVEDEF
jgi:hypothetical protein